MSCIWPFLYHFMYYDNIEPGDTFPIMMRKLVMAAGGLVGFMAVYGVIQKVMSKQANTSTTYIIMGCYLSLMVTLFGSWIYVKRTHTAPSWLIAIWTNFLAVTMLLFILCNPNYPWEFALIALMCCVPFLGMHSVNLIIPIACLLIFGYNFSLGRMGAPYPLMVFPGGFDQAPGELIQAYVHSRHRMYIRGHVLCAPSKRGVNADIPRRYSRQ